MVSLAVLKRFHLCSALAAAVASRLHGHREVRGTAERGYEKWYKKRYHGFRLLDQVSALEISASRHLRFHDLICLLDQDRDKPERNGHHHGHLVDRNADLL